MIVKGYKIFEPNWTCKGFQYEIGKTYKINSKPKCCKKGFHFCMNITYCFYYYPLNSLMKCAEIEAIGEIDRFGNKLCTNQIKIINEIPWNENGILKILDKNILNEIKLNMLFTQVNLDIKDPDFNIKFDFFDKQIDAINSVLVIL